MNEHLEGKWLDAIDLAADTILNTRDFCGNEKAAALEVLAECGFTGAEALVAYRDALASANRHWNTYRRLAGVEGA